MTVASPSPFRTVRISLAGTEVPRGASSSKLSCRGGNPDRMTMGVVSGMLKAMRNAQSRSAKVDAGVISGKGHGAPPAGPRARSLRDSPAAADISANTKDGNIQHFGQASRHRISSSFCGFGPFLARINSHFMHVLTSLGRRCHQLMAIRDQISSKSGSPISHSLVLM